AYFFSPVAAAFNFEPAESLTPWPAGISIASPVRGLRPVRAARLVRSTENQPGMVIFSPLETCEAKTSNTASSTPLTAVAELPDFSATAATSSLRFIAICPPGLLVVLNPTFAGLLWEKLPPLARFVALLAAIFEEFRRNTPISDK